MMKRPYYPLVCRPVPQMSGRFALVPIGLVSPLDEQPGNWRLDEALSLNRYRVLSRGFGQHAATVACQTGLTCLCGTR
jgi:hypothetical protein